MSYDTDSPSDPHTGGKMDYTQCAARIAELEAALYKAHGILGPLSAATDGQLRRRICTVYNIVGKPIGRGRSSHGDEADE